MNISSIMHREVATIDLEASAKEAGDKMHQFNIRHLPVMNGPNLAGIVSNRDVALVSGLMSKEDQKLKNLKGENVPVKDIMTPHPVILSPQDSLTVAMDQAIKDKIELFPVMDKGKLVGVVSVIDLLRGALEVIESR